MEELIILLKYIFLGSLQGFTEPIPISSSGHLVIAQELFGLNMSVDDFTFEILMNFASLLAVLAIYRKDLIRLVTNSLSYVRVKTEETKKDFQFVLYLIIATIPAGVIGLLFEDTIASVFRSSKTVAVSLIATGIALFFIRNLKGRKNDGDLTWKDAVIVGFAQAIALIPGVSRSGATIVAAMGLGMKQETALRFSFLLFIPISLGLILVKIPDLALGDMWLPYLLAFIFSFGFSYFALKWFMNIMARGNLIYFTIYCLVVGFGFLIFG
ncbi:undecaprenyl-diphosphate phosphatase [Chryseomicrobium aureum]|uniref:undecaprenyl-diphosphate phosphatase n=1 Tax=Chryseomicrobium aureum TaxID=1441723 RepID=UPI00370DAB07